MIDPGRMSLKTVMERLRNAAEGDRVTIGDVLDSFGSRAYGPLLFVLSLFVLSPLGAIPGASILAGTVMILLAVKMLAARGGAPWVPGFMGRIGIGGHRARQAIGWAEGKVTRLDRVVGPRWSWATGPWLVRISAGAIALLAATFYPLAIVPWGVVPPALAACLLALALFTRDGVILVAGLLTTLGTVLVALWFFL